MADRNLSSHGYGIVRDAERIAATELAMMTMSDDGCPHDNLPIEEKEQRFLVTLEDFFKERNIRI